MLQVERMALSGRDEARLEGRKWMSGLLDRTGLKLVLKVRDRIATDGIFSLSFDAFIFRPRLNDFEFNSLSIGSNGLVRVAFLFGDCDDDDPCRPTSNTLLRELAGHQFEPQAEVPQTSGRAVSKHIEGNRFAAVTNPKVDRWLSEMIVRLPRSNTKSNGFCDEYQRSVGTSGKRGDLVGNINGETWQIGLRFQQFARPANSIWLYFLLIKNLQSIRQLAQLYGRNSSAQFGKPIYEPRIELNRFCSEQEGQYRVCRAQSSIGKALPLLLKVASPRAGTGQIML